MNEFVREVDEEYRRDRVAQFWQRWSGAIVGVLVLVVIGVGAWRYWQHYEQQQAQAAALRFYEANALAQSGKTQEAEAALSGLAADAPGGYELLARFRLAAARGAQDAAAGASAYDALAADTKVPATMRDFARLRAAMLRLDSEPDAALASLQSLAAPENPFRHSAREMLGLAALKRNDFEAAGRWFDQIAADPAAPAGLKGRLEIYSALVAGGPVQVSQ
jgi:hypothetical protein